MPDGLPNQRWSVRRAARFFHCATDVNEVIGHDIEADPSSSVTIGVEIVLQGPQSSDGGAVLEQQYSRQRPPDSLLAVGAPPLGFGPLSGPKFPRAGPFQAHPTRPIIMASSRDRTDPSLSARPARPRR